MTEKISVIGAGSWGTTLANLLSAKGHDTLLYVYEEDQYVQMTSLRINQKYLPGIQLEKALKFTHSLDEASSFARTIVLAVPSHAVRGVMNVLNAHNLSEKLFINVAKGIENDTLLRMSQVIQQVSGVNDSQIVSLYGPSHAEEVSRGVATAVVSASSSLESARKVRQIFRTDYFRVYSSADIIGVELGGSLKNVIAIAAGIADGAGFGDNTKAALMTRALVEMTRLGVKMGAQVQTFSGLSGIGDLIVTCMSRHSRNRHVGEQIGRGKTLQEVLDEMVMVAEGVKTTRSVHQLQKEYKVEMPISEEVYKVLFKGKNPHHAVRDLMTRDPKEELSDSFI
ncbi:MAG TPA: NAD(P)H-dependent glycerol-3-phosphate dehydrogenase [Caldithrix sp.]|nr:NAD(P)H-dependent glycerol-3-phosphate dehydrogenase [Caldithrix sp.]